jgi:hypothetical protein
MSTGISQGIGFIDRLPRLSTQHLMGIIDATPQKDGFENAHSQGDYGLGPAAPRSAWYSLADPLKPPRPRSDPELTPRETSLMKPRLMGRMSGVGRTGVVRPLSVGWPRESLVGHRDEVR